MIPTDKRNDYYEKYLSDLSDHFDQSKEQKAPIHVGEKIRHLREKQRLTLEDLAEKTGFKVEMLENIEKEAITPPLGTMMKLSRALNTLMSSIISEKAGNKTYSVLRAKDQKSAPLPLGKVSDHSYIPVGTDLEDRHMDPFIVKLNPVKNKTLAPAVHEGEEFIYVLDGEVKITIEEHEEILSMGDAFYLKSTAPHLVTSNTDQPAMIMAVLYSGS
ncbi:MAG: helix-turn-helix transcriptional regulator [Deltaproteobacteria bacterium]|nr:helix-turn-helix transcriptional regulator [Candidatus Anaeroferrophillus wilburensis]MBN2888562.1 helix-turn-helix transcriptional regulator [Deltaproteobacteria bacterium]